MAGRLGESFPSLTHSLVETIDIAPPRRSGQKTVGLRLIRSHPRWAKLMSKHNLYLLISHGAAASGPVSQIKEGGQEDAKCYCTRCCYGDDQSCFRRRIFD